MNTLWIQEALSLLMAMERGFFVVLATLFVAVPAVVSHRLLQARVDWSLEESRQLRVILVARSLQAVAFRLPYDFRLQ